MAHSCSQAFNGRFFSEDPDVCEGEVMNSVFLSEPGLFRKEVSGADQTLAEKHQEEVALLAKFSDQHGRVNFDRLPTCPLCLERLDNAVTGLHQTPTDEVSRDGRSKKHWPGQINACMSCKNTVSAADQTNEIEEKL